MTDFYEIDFLSVGSSKSGDAITMRYQVNGQQVIHVTDGGYQSTGEAILVHMALHYDNPQYIDHVIATHNDGDHCGGLRTVLEERLVGALWMNRPWLHVDELIHRFTRYTNKENLRRRLREIYSNLAALEEIAEKRGIPIYDAFVGARIGAWTVLSPSYDEFLDRIAESERTPEADTAAKSASTGVFDALVKPLVNLVESMWGHEIFSDEETSAENEMSIVQGTILCGDEIVLTADAGRKALTTAAANAYLAGIVLPGVKRIQIPHHGSRRNVSSEILDAWLGFKSNYQPSPSAFTRTAIVSASLEDKDHPRKSVIRAFMHRYCNVLSTEGQGWTCIFQNAPPRAGAVPCEPLPYPSDQEA